MGSHSLLQGIFLAQGWHPGLLHCRQILYCLNHPGSLIDAKIPTKWKKFTTWCSWACSPLRIDSMDTCDPSLLPHHQNHAQADHIPWDNPLSPGLWKCYAETRRGVWVWALAALDSLPDTCNKHYAFLHRNLVLVDWLYCLQVSGPSWFGNKQNPRGLDIASQCHFWALTVCKATYTYCSSATHPSTLTTWNVLEVSTVGQASL